MNDSNISTRKEAVNIEKNGTGIHWKNVSGICKGAVVAVLTGAFAVSSMAHANEAFTAQHGEAVLFVDGPLATFSWSGPSEKLIGSVMLEDNYGVANVLRIGGNGTGEKIGGNGTGEKIGGDGTGKPIGGNGTGSKIGGNGTGEKIGGNGTGKPIGGNGTGGKIGGNGTGEKIGGDGTGKPIGGNGTGSKIGGNGTGEKIGGDGTGERAMVIWGAAEIVVEGDLAYVVLYEKDRRGSFIEAATLEIPVVKGN